MLSFPTTLFATHVYNPSTSVFKSNVWLMLIDPSSSIVPQGTLSRVVLKYQVIFGFEIPWAMQGSRVFCRLVNGTSRLQLEVITSGTLNYCDRNCTLIFLHHLCISFYGS